MSIMRSDPWSEPMSLRQAMDTLLQESFIRPRAGEGSTGTSVLTLDVEEREDDFVVSAPVPGIDPKHVELSILGDTLRIRAERKDERQQEGDGKRWLLREQRYGAFERTVTLPCAVKADKAAAEFKDGLLTVTLPKGEEAKERRIPIRAAQNQDQQQKGGQQQLKA